MLHSVAQRGRTAKPRVSGFAAPPWGHGLAQKIAKTSKRFLQTDGTMPQSLAQNDIHIHRIFTPEPKNFSERRSVSRSCPLLPRRQTSLMVGGGGVIIPRVRCATLGCVVQPRCGCAASGYHWMAVSLNGAPSITSFVFYAFFCGEFFSFFFLFLPSFPSFFSPCPP